MEQEGFDRNLNLLRYKQDTGKLSCGLITSQDDFIKFGLMDNFEATTLKLFQRLWSDDSEFRTRMYHYCSYNCINFYMLPEYGQSNNKHYHGLIGFPSPQVRKRFQVWFNKNFGKLYTSTKTDINKWYGYVHKSQTDTTYFKCMYAFGDGEFDSNNVTM